MFTRAGFVTASLRGVVAWGETGPVARFGFAAGLGMEPYLLKQGWPPSRHKGMEGVANAVETGGVVCRWSAPYNMVRVMKHGGVLPTRPCQPVYLTGSIPEAAASMGKGFKRHPREREKTS